MTTRIAVFLLLARMASGQSVYRDPDGQFIVQVPAGWQSSKVPDRAATVGIKKGSAFVNLSVEPASSPASDTMKNYEKVVAQNCPAYRELQRGPSTISGVAGLSLHFTCADPKLGIVNMTVAMASRNGQLIFFYASAPENEYGVLKGDIEAILNGFHLTAASAPASGDPQKLAALEKACVAGVFTPAECAAKRAGLTGGTAAIPAHASAGDVSQVYRDPRGRFSVTAAAGWLSSPMGDGGADGVQIAHGTSWTVISPFGGSVPSPGDVVNQVANQIQSQYKNVHLVAHNPFKIGAHDAAYAMFTATNAKGEQVTVTVSGVAASGGHFLAVVSSVPLAEAQAISPILTQISQSIRFDEQ